MKVTKNLFINGEKVKFSNDTIRLLHSRPGMAYFDIETSETVSGIVELVVGYSHLKNTYISFCGYISQCTKQNDDICTIECYELTNILKNNIVLNLENVTLNEILQAISDKTGLEFSTPDQDYTEIKVAQFYNVSSGYHALDSLAKIFNIPNFCWHQQGNKSVFVGSWKHSFFAKKQVKFSEKFFDSFNGSNSARMALHPGIRPGMKINGRLLTSVQLSGVHMDLECATR